jgi:nitrate reductase gamma subunit
MVELFSAIQNLVNVLFHNGLNLGQVLIESGIIFVLALIPKFSLLSLNNRIVMYKLKGSSRLVDSFAPLWLLLREGEIDQKNMIE